MHKHAYMISLFEFRVKYEVCGTMYEVLIRAAESAQRNKEIKKANRRQGKISELTDVKSSSWLVVGETEETIRFHLSIDSTQWSSSGQMSLSVLCSHLIVITAH